MKPRLFGISLIEMLISMTLIAAIIGILGGSFFQSDSFRKNIEEKLESRKKFRNVRAIFREDFKNMVFLSGYTQPIFKKPRNQSGLIGRKETIGETRIDQVVFHTHHPTIFQNGLELKNDPSLYEIGYFLVRNESVDTYSLYRREEFYLNETFKLMDAGNAGTLTQSNNKSVSRVMLSNVVSLKIRYLDEILEEEEKWIDEWDSNINTNDKRIPQAVEITLVLYVGPDDIDEFSQERKNFEVEDRFVINIRPNFGIGVKWAN